MELLKILSDLINNNPGKAAGAFIGFIFGVLLFTLGPLDTLFITLLVLAGIIVGKSRDDGVSIVDTITGFFRRGGSDEDDRCEDDGEE